MEYRSGFISVIGRTNVGKSTLLNSIIGQKISIVSDRPQTTRNNIRLIYTTDDCQMVFIDTPGFHKPKCKLSSFMVDSATHSIKDVDLVLFLVEEDASIGKGDQLIIDKLQDVGIPVILVINKIDKITNDQLLNKVSLFTKYKFINEIVPVSAMTGKNIDELLNVIKSYLPEGPMFYDEDMVTDKAERFVVTEIIREKALRFLKDEVPHSLAVEILSMKEREDKDIVDIEATILCDKSNHKMIIIGKNGSMIKKIGTKAREEIEEMLDCKVNLKLWVKVKEGWRDSLMDLRSLGYTEEE